MWIIICLFSLLAVIACGYFMVKLQISSAKRLYKFICLSGFGTAFLWLLNFVLLPFRFQVGVNYLSALICGLLGLPGAVLTLCLNFIF